MKTFISSFYNIVLSLWVGGVFLFTFIVTPVIFKTQDRQVAGSIVGHLFPYYFLFNLALSGIALLIFSFTGKGAVRWMSVAALILLISALVINLFSLALLYPKMERLKSDMKSLEPVPQNHPLRQRFLQFHALSSVLNLAFLFEGILLVILHNVRPG
jgi:hypothetical protein